MASPCVGTRVNSSKGNTPFYPRALIEGGTIEKLRPSGFQVSGANVNVCGHPKQAYPQSMNGLALGSRKLGSIRSSLLEDRSTHEVVIGKKNEHSISRRAEFTEKYNTKNDRRYDSLSKPVDRSLDQLRYENRKSSGRFATLEEKQRKRNATSSISTMLSSSGHIPKKHSTFAVPPRFHEQTAPDAKRDRYNVHKWRRKSSRHRYAGMESSPILAQRLKRETGINRIADFNETIQLSAEERAVNFISEVLKKPRMPLPGVNMLPALHVHPRSETGASGREEISLRFARNIAMEELERRFYDDKGKIKQLHIPRNQQITNSNSENLHKEYLRNVTHRRAGVLMPIQIKHSDNTQRSSEFSSPTDTPGKAADDLEQSDVGDVSKKHHGRKQDEESVGTDHITYQDMHSDTVRFRVFDESFSEETVTIVGKPSESTSPTKQSGVGTVAFNRSLEGGPSDHMKHSDTTSMAYIPAGKRYPVLQDLAKVKSEQYSDNVLPAMLNKLHSTHYRHDKFARTGRNSQKSLDHNGKRPPKTHGKRVALPQLQFIDNQARKDETQTKKRLGQKVSKQIRVEACASPQHGPSPIRKKSISSKTSPLSHASNSSYGAKDSSTPADSLSSQNTTGGRRRSRKWRRFSRMESKGSPQFQKALKQSKLTKLMRKWKTVIRIVIMINRLCDDHHIISDDSYNIHFASSKNRQFQRDVKKEVLFDLSDYKMKNQQKLSDTTRKILTTLPEQRTQQDIKIIQTTLRNLKAISDHSAAVQMNIAKHGYVVGFNSKRVVVLENRLPLNFYVLLAGSAVMIKKDDNGNTNPISFIKRGDVFGEREILNNETWGWSLVTVDPCEFLLLDKVEYIRIFLDGGSGGLLNDPDRGAFLTNLSLFQGWPMHLLNSNPNRCLFRYFKRGALLARNDEDSEWIFVIKSGSCSVLKPMRVETLTRKDIFRKLIDEQTAKFSAGIQTELIERIEKSTREDHMQQLEEIAKVLHTAKANSTTSYQRIEIASLLKELNIDLKNTPLTPVNEEEEDQARDIAYSRNLSREEIDFNKENDSEPMSPNAELRMSRVSDRRAPPRTPSPMKAAYLQTGYLSPLQGTSQNKAFTEGNVRTVGENRTVSSNNNGNMEIKEATEFNLHETDHPFSDFDEPLSEEDNKRNSESEKLKSVYINIRKLTKGNTFGLDSTLFREQPNMALVSNGAECLLLNKKFYLDNLTDQVLKRLREVEHPYPSDANLLESYWRLMSWAAFKKRIMKQVYQRKALLRQ